MSVQIGAAQLTSIQFTELAIILNVVTTSYSNAIEKQINLKLGSTIRGFQNQINSNALALCTLSSCTNNGHSELTHGIAQTYEKKPQNVWINMKSTVRLNTLSAFFRLRHSMSNNVNQTMNRFQMCFSVV